MVISDAPVSATRARWSGDRGGDQWKLEAESRVLDASGVSWRVENGELFRDERGVSKSIALPVAEPSDPSPQPELAAQEVWSPLPDDVLVLAGHPKQGCVLLHQKAAGTVPVIGPGEDEPIYVEVCKATHGAEPIRWRGTDCESWAQYAPGFVEEGSGGGDGKN